MIKFEKLKNTDYKFLKETAKKSFFEHSFYCPASILMWNECVNSYYFSRLEKGLLIMEEGEDHPQKKRLLMPFDEKRYSPLELSDILKDAGLKSFYYCPDNYFSQGISQAEEFFNIYVQEDSCDYIYDTQDLALLKGSKYSKKRNLIYQFEKNFVETGLTEVLVINKTNAADILSISQTWKDQKEAQELMDIMECEFKAIDKAVKNWEEFELFGVSVYIDKKIAGFALGSFLNSKTADLNFEKARKDIKGLYQFLDREFAKSIPSEFSFINKESDMGIPGLAKAKSSYHPVKKLKSYILELK